MDFSLLYVRINFWRDQGNTNSGKHNQSEIHSFDLLFIVDLEKIIVGNRWLWHVFSLSYIRIGPITTIPPFSPGKETTLKQPN